MNTFLFFKKVNKLIALLFIMLVSSCSSVDDEYNSEICNNGVMQPMEEDPYCGYVDIGAYCLEEINYYRGLEGLDPFLRAEQFDECAAREARLALEAGVDHYDDGCGWNAQASVGGGRGGDDSEGTVQKSVAWVPKLIYAEGPDGGHYKGMMTERVRYVASGYYATDRDNHKIIINYYDNID